MKKLIALLLCLVLAVGVFAGCGKAAEVRNMFVGEWKYISSYIDWTLKITPEEIGITLKELEAFRLYINDDDTFLYDFGDNATKEGTYEIDTNNMTISLRYEIFGEYHTENCALIEEAGELILVQNYDITNVYVKV